MLNELAGLRSEPDLRSSTAQPELELDAHGAFDFNRLQAP